MKNQSTHDKVKRYLKSGRVITGLIAWRKFSCYRLSSIIHRLRRDGMKIRTTIHFASKQYSFASYKLIKP